MGDKPSDMSISELRKITRPAGVPIPFGTQKQDTISTSELERASIAIVVDLGI